MLNPVNLQNDILGGILQNFSGMLSNVQNINVAGVRALGASAAEEVNAADGSNNTIPFSQLLAQRLAEVTEMDEDAIRVIINEEITSAVDANSTELVALLSRLNEPGMNNLLSLFNNTGFGGFGGLAGLGSSSADSLARMLGGMGMPAVSGGTSALLGMANPIDSLRFYNAMLEMRRS